MAPRQLRPEPIEDDMTADKGTIARPSDCLWHLLALPGTAQRTAGSGLMPDHCLELRLMAREVSAAKCSKDPFGSRSTPLYYHSFGCPLQHPTGFSNFQMDFGVIR
eukprot:scaffold7745_cov116-Isochrysis_galbana.AAC.2